jgi:general secretion pathway protein A
MQFPGQAPRRQAMLAMGDSALGDRMYLAHFGLREPPFSITPDPRFLYMSARHREALAHLIYGVGEHGGFVQLTGEVGTGKTSVCRCLLEQLPANVDLALVFNPRLSPVELLATVCDELRIAYPAGTTSPKELVDRLHRHLLEAHTAGRRTVLIIDEAQNLAPEVLEEVRLLTNLETAREKLLQVILIGQPELAAILEQPKLRQLAQRVTARYHLEPLSRQETVAYIRHRLAVAGRGRTVFTAGALRSLYRRSRGIPRIINAMADRALLGAYTRERSQVDAATVRRAAAEVLGQTTAPWHRWVRGAAVAALVAALGALGLVLLAPGEIGRSEVGRENSLSSAASPSLTGGLSMPTSASQSAPGPRLADVLRDPGIPATKGDALAVLQGLWGVPPTGILPDCDRPVPGALECLAAVGTWQKLRRLDLPAALELAGPGGERRYGVLTALTPSEATLRFGDRVVTALLAEIEPFWNGGFVLLWRPPPGDFPVQRGARGPATDWLRQRMARASGQLSEPGLPYDQNLWERVTAFQRARSLEADGVVSRETAIVLRGAEWGPEVPRLAARVP